MTSFDEQLLRLKQQLGVAEDQAAAAALGFNKAAFSARKRRGAFPVEAVYALQARQPELKLDVTYVLTGKSAHLAAVAAAASTAAAGRRAIDAFALHTPRVQEPPPPGELGQQSQPAPAEAEARLLTMIRQLLPADRAALDRLLSSLVDKPPSIPAAAPVPKRRKR